MIIGHRDLVAVVIEAALEWPHGIDVLILSQLEDLALMVHRISLHKGYAVNVCRRWLRGTLVTCKWCKQAHRQI
jgi:hypothetical protein